MSRPLKVFLSHAHADADAVRALYDRLVADGVDAWLDKEKLIPGQDWEREIRKAVREADVVIVCLSKQFNQRGYRQKEVRIALDEAEMMPEGEIFIIPARLEECENLESLRKWHWVDLYEKGGYKHLLRSLQFRAKKVEAELEPKKNLITGAFKKPIIKRQTNSKPKDGEKETEKARDKVQPSFWQKLKILNKKEVQKWVVGILILAFLYSAVFILPSYFPKTKPLPQATPTQTQTVAPTATLYSPTLQPSKTPVSTRTPTISPTPKNTKTPRPTSTSTKSVSNTPNSTKVSEIDDAKMLLVQGSGEVNSFWIYETAVTNSMFGEFVNDTGYVTDAEKDGVGYVWALVGEISATQFTGQTFLDYEWKLQSGVTWKTPSYEDYGVGYCQYEARNCAGGDEVLQVSWNDATAYCQWAGKELLNIDEWNLALQSKLPITLYNFSPFDGGRVEWAENKTTSIYRAVLGYEDVDWGHNINLFGEKGFAENRSADKLTFRCKE